MTTVHRMRERLSYANVTATLALFIALSGTSYAAVTLPRDSVGPNQIRRDAVRGAEIRNGAVSTAEIRNGSVGVNDISKRARETLRGSQGLPGPVGPPGPAGITEHVQVTSSGFIAGGTTASSHWSIDQPGLYEIRFGRDVSRCAFAGSLAAVPGGNVNEPSAGRITVASGGGGIVFVKTYDAAGTSAEQPFHLIVAC